MKPILPLLALCLFATGCMPKYHNAEYTYPGSGTSQAFGNTADHHHPDVHYHGHDRRGR